MNELMDMGTKGNLISYFGNAGSILGDVLDAIPLAVAAPILSWQKTKAQKELLKLLIEKRCLERAEILKTMQILASKGELTPELAQQLMVAYHQQPY